MEERDLTIGQVARQAGVHVETVRYYQRLGLIEEPPRPWSGYRRYPVAVVDRIRFIKRAQELGFRLAEIGELLAMDQGSCAEVRARAEAKRAQIAAQIRDLVRLRQTLDELIRRCRAEESAPGCPIVESLTGAGRSTS